MTSREPLPIDPRAARHFVRRRLARRLPVVDPLAREIETRMAERLSMIRIAPYRVLDAGAGNAPVDAFMRARYPDADVIALDYVRETLPTGRAATGPGGVLRRLLPRARERRLHRVCADFAALPFAGATFDLIWSNLALGSTHAHEPVFREWQRVLRPGGLVFFSAFGPDTLTEWRRAVAAIGPHERVHRFVDMHDLGDMLARTGFADPVMEMERLTFTYATFEALLDEWRGMAAPNALASRARGLLGRRAFAAMRDAYAQSCEGGRWPLTFEIIYGHAWQVARTHAGDGRAVMRFIRNAKPSS